MIPSHRKKKLPNTQRVLIPKPEEPSKATVNIQFDATPCLCPFCLYSDFISRFQTKTASGKSSKMYKCPDCRITMRQDSLTKHMTTEEYAQWVFDYPAAAFWHKIPYSTWKERLRGFGLSRDFWNKYHQLKGESGPSYSDYMNAEGEKWALEQADEYEREQEKAHHIDSI
jgi:hypothetical protein